VSTWLRRLAVVGGLVVAAALGMMVVNRAAFGRLTLNPSLHMFLMARLSETPLLKAYLERTCAREPLSICEALPELPSVSAQYFLWEPDAIGGRVDWLATKPEYDRIIREILMSPPALASFAGNSVWRGVRLLGSLDLTPFYREGDDSAATDRIEAFFPREAGAYRAARQFTDALGLRAAAEQLHWLGFAAAIVVLGCRLARGLERAPAHAAAFCLAGIAANALVMGGLSAVDGRYHGRVAWLVVLFALVPRQRSAAAGACGPTACSAGPPRSRPA
jgi:hypothetical protein